MDRLAMPAAALERVLSAVRAAAILYVAVAAFPPAHSYFSLHPGLDISWVYGLNQFASDPWKFGRDVNFTFGPLGFLLYPANVGNHIPYAIAFRLAVTALFILCLAFLSRRGRTPGLVLFAAGYGVALGVGHVFEFHLLILVALGILVALERRSLAGMVLVAALSGPLALTKFSLAPGVAAVVLTGAVAWVVLRHGSSRSALAVVVTHLGTLLAAAWLTMKSLENVALWFRASLEMVSGYSVAMSLIPGWSDQRLGIAICVLLALTAAVLHRLRPQASLTLVLLGGAVFLAYKAGVVREDGHVVMLYGFGVAGVAAASIAAGSFKEQLALATALLAAVTVAVVGETRRGYLQSSSLWELSSGRAGARGIARAMHPSALADELDRATAAALAPDLLPQEIRAVLGRSSVMVMPTELIYCLANELNCVPPPTLQLYSAYTPYLDTITAAQLRGLRAPEFLLIHDLRTIDLRHVVLDDPLTWRAIFAGYEPARSTGGVAVLRKRAGAHERVPRLVMTDTLRFGVWLPVPSGPGRLFAEIPLTMTTRGSLTKVVHRIPPGYMELKRRSGAVERHRILFDMAGTGLLIHPLATDLRDLPAMFDGREADPPIALRFFGPATRFYRDGAQVRWILDQVPEPDRSATTSNPE